MSLRGALGVPFCSLSGGGIVMLAAGAHVNSPSSSSCPAKVPPMCLVQTWRLHGEGCPGTVDRSAWIRMQAHPGASKATQWIAQHSFVPNTRVPGPYFRHAQEPLPADTDPPSAAQIQDRKNPTGFANIPWHRTSHTLYGEALSAWQHFPGFGPRGLPAPLVDQWLWQSRLYVHRPLAETNVQLH